MITAKINIDNIDKLIEGLETLVNKFPRDTALKSSLDQYLRIKDKLCITLQSKSTKSHIVNKQMVS